MVVLGHREGFLIYFEQHCGHAVKGDMLRTTETNRAHDTQLFVQGCPLSPEPRLPMTSFNRMA